MLILLNYVFLSMIAGSIIFDAGHYLTFYPTIILNKEGIPKQQHNYFYVTNKHEVKLLKKYNKIVVSDQDFEDVDYVIGRDIWIINPEDLLYILSDIQQFENKFISVKLKDVDYLQTDYIDFNVEIKIVREENAFIKDNLLNIGVVGSFENWSRIPIINEQYIPVNTNIVVPFYIYIKLMRTLPNIQIELYTDLITAYIRYLKSRYNIEIQI